MSKKKIQFIEGPVNGWEPHCLYLVEVSYNATNPIHRALFFSGFLDDTGYPANYNGVMQRTPYTHETEMAVSIQEIYYLCVVEMLVYGDAWEEGQAGKMPPKGPGPKETLLIKDKELKEHGVAIDALEARVVTLEKQLKDKSFKVESLIMVRERLKAENIEMKEQVAARNDYIRRLEEQRTMKASESEEYE